MTKTGRDSDQFALRLPDGMRDRIRSSAESNRRSMNAEIVHCLDRILGKEAQEKGATEAATSSRHVTSNPR